MPSSAAAVAELGNKVVARLEEAFRALMSAVLVVLAPVAALAQDVLRGHGGPVRALAVNGPARELISGSFDSTVIVWDLDRGTAKRVLRFHEGPVNAVAVLDHGCFASGGEDRRVAIWCGEETKPRRVLEGHEAPVTSLSAHDTMVVSGSFDGTFRAWDIAGGPGLTQSVQGGAVTSVSILSSERGADFLLAVGTAEGKLQAGGAHGRSTLQLGTAVAAIAGDRAGIVGAAGDGKIRLFDVGLGPVGEIEVESMPLSSLALSPDGKLIATAGLRGGIAIIERATRKILHRLTGPGLPVWSLVFDSDSRTLISGGADRTIRRWDAVEGRALSPTVPERDLVAEAAASGERGAVVFRACQACHTLSPDDGNRAGPTLHGIFGRRIGSAAGYNYSESLPRMSIVWSKATVARLFEVGPNTYTPGTKMPEQTITNADDRQALVEWLERVTR